MPEPHPSKVQCRDCRNVYEAELGQCPLCNCRAHQPWVDPNVAPATPPAEGPCHTFVERSRAMMEGACPCCLRDENGQMSSQMALLLEKLDGVDKGWADTVARDFIHKTEHLRMVSELQSEVDRLKAAIADSHSRSPAQW